MLAAGSAGDLLAAESMLMFPSNNDRWGYNRGCHLILFFAAQVSDRNVGTTRRETDIVAQVRCAEYGAAVDLNDYVTNFQTSALSWRIAFNGADDRTG